MGSAGSQASAQGQEGLHHYQTSDTFLNRDWQMWKHNKISCTSQNSVSLATITALF